MKQEILLDRFNRRLHDIKVLLGFIIFLLISCIGLIVLKQVVWSLIPIVLALICSIAAEGGLDLLGVVHDHCIKNKG